MMITVKGNVDLRRFCLKKKNNKGAAMMLTIIIIAVLVVFTFSLILISYNLYASQNKNLSSDRNAEAANSLSKALEDELTDNNASDNSNLWKYLRYNIAYKDADEDCLDWPYYAPGKTSHGSDEARRYFKLARNIDMAGMPADVSVCMYWELPDIYLNANDVPVYDSTKSRSGIILHIEITCSTGSQTYRVNDVYELSAIVDSNVLVPDGINNDVTSYNPEGHEINPKERWKWTHISRR